MTQLWTPKRDFIGYGPNPLHPHWPGEARVARQIVINYEEARNTTMPVATVGPISA